ncbi:MAG TPA: zinc ribbon domain-containing protein [Terriglobales bacterium]|nr:zinc ribbon domain-containing protein [Terriglobales bacterium]
MNDQGQAVAIIAVLVMVLIFLGIWACLIVFGVKAANKKHRSPHWMWFGIHPVGALIAFIVMMCLDPLRLCPQCGRPVPSGARVCPYCAFSLAPAAPPPAPPAA